MSVTMSLTMKEKKERGYVLCLGSILVAMGSSLGMLPVAERLEGSRFLVRELMEELLGFIQGNHGHNPRRYLDPSP